MTKPSSSQSLWTILLALTGSLLAIVAFYFFPWKFVIVGILWLIVLALSVRYTTMMFYGVVALYPFLGAQLIYGSINAPLVDFLAMTVFAAWGMKRLLHWKAHPLTWHDLPAGIFALAFFVTGALSLAHNPSLVSGVKYLARPLVFFYLMYVLLPYHVLVTKEHLLKALRIIVVVGSLIAFSSLAAYALNSNPWYAKRVSPVYINGMNVIGGNHNAIAEILLVTIPAAFIFFSRAKSVKTQKWWLLLLGVLCGALLLTYSRSGWLGLLTEAAIFGLLQYRKSIDYRKVVAVGIALMTVALIGYFTVWQFLPFIKTSDESRLMITQIAITHFLEHPIIGNGLNMYVPIVGDTFAFTVEYGAPLDSHGFMQKLLLEQGSLGLIAYVSLLIALVWRIERSWTMAIDESSRVLLLTMMAMVGGIIMMQLFSTSYYDSRMWLPITLAVVAARVFNPLGIERRIG